MVTERNGSVWSAIALPQGEPLDKDKHVDVCVVGAGIAGLSVAYLLSREGRSVAVVEDGSIGGGQTQQTTAHLASVLDSRYFELERTHGIEGARLAAESHSAAIDRIEAIVAAESIACDFERLDGYLCVPPGESTNVLKYELGAVRRTGLSVEYRLGVPGVGFDFGPSLRFPRQAQFHPLKYLLAFRTPTRMVKVYPKVCRAT